MRALHAAALLLIVALAGCNGGVATKAAPATPATGLEPALAAARAWSADARLLWLEGSENPQAATVDEDGGPLGFYQPLYGAKDPAVGDGNVTAWLWAFSSPTQALPHLVMTKGSKVVGEREAEDWRMEEDFAGLVPYDTAGLFLDTPAMAAVLNRDSPGWADGTFAHGGVRWLLASGADGLRWEVDGELDNGDSGFIRAFYFDAKDGALVGASAEDESIVPPPARTLVLSDCTNFGGVFPVPMADAQAALPAGLTPVASPNDPTGGATLYILFLDCGGSAVDGNDTGPVLVEYAELAVVPPENHTLPGISDYTVPLAIGAGVEAVADRLAEFMLGHAGRATVMDVTDGAPGPRRARMVVDGVTLDVTGQFAGSASTLRDGGFALIGVQDGVVKTVVQASSQGGSATQGTVTQQSAGLPVFQQARPVAAGFSVSGFTLTFTLVKTL